MIKALCYKGYLGTKEFSQEVSCYFGKLLGIKDLVLYEGETEEALYKDFQDAIESYIDFHGKEAYPDYKGYEIMVTVS